MNKHEITDAELRELRNAVYPPHNEKQVQTDEAWEMVKPAWRKDVEWLREVAALNTARTDGGSKRDA